MQYIKFSDVTPLPLGIETKGGMFSVIIKKNTTVPCYEMKEYYTTHDNQKEVDILIYQGEEEKVFKNFRLGKFTLKGIPPGLKGRMKIEVTIQCNIEGFVTVKALCPSNGRAADTTIWLDVEEHKPGLTEGKVCELREELRKENN